MADDQFLNWLIGLPLGGWQTHLYVRKMIAVRRDLGQPCVIGVAVRSTATDDMVTGRELPSNEQGSISTSTAFQQAPSTYFFVEAQRPLLARRQMRGYCSNQGSSSQESLSSWSPWDSGSSPMSSFRWRPPPRPPRRPPPLPPRPPPRLMERTRPSSMRETWSPR